MATKARSSAASSAFSSAFSSAGGAPEAWPSSSNIQWQSSPTSDCSSRKEGSAQRLRAASLEASSGIVDMACIAFGLMSICTHARGNNWCAQAKEEGGCWSAVVI